MAKDIEGFAPKLYQSIIAALQEDIANGIFPKGSRLPSERALVERFKVSRLTVREAIVGMEMLGVVEARRGSGVHVKESFSPSNISMMMDIGDFHLTEARRLIEAESAALAAKAATAEDKSLLIAAFDNLKVTTGDYMDGLNRDMEFHVQIARCTHNPAIVLVIEMLWKTRLNSPLSMEMVRRTGPMQQSAMINEHEPIVKEIIAGNAAGARSAMRSHLSQSISRLLHATEIEEVESARERVADRRARAAFLE